MVENRTRTGEGDQTRKDLSARDEIQRTIFGFTANQRPGMEAEGRKPQVGHLRFEMGKLSRQAG